MTDVINKLIADILGIVEDLEQRACELTGPPSIASCEAILALRDAQAVMNKSRDLVSLAVLQQRDVATIGD